MKLSSLHFAAPLAVSLLLPAMQVEAQSDAGALLNEQQRSQQKLPQRLPSVETESMSPELKSVNGAHIVLQAVRFSGAMQLVPEAELQALVRDAVGQQIDFAGMQQLAERVTAYLHKKGYFLARAMLPRQEVTDGTLEIRLLEGRLDGSTPSSIVPDPAKPPRIDSERLNLYLSTHLKPGTAVTDSALERTVLLINDLPGISAQAQLQAGQDPDSTRVLLNTQEGPPVIGSASLDNYGNKDTGATQLSVNAELNDPLHIGDQLAAGITHTQGLDLEHINYALPLGADGLKLNASVTHMDYRIVRGSGQAAGLLGTSDSAGLTLTYPFIRSRELNVYGALGYAEKKLVDNASIGQVDDKRDKSWTASLSGDALDGFSGGGLTNWTLGATTGKLDLSGNAASLAADAAGYGSQGSFNKLNYSASRLQKLPANFTLSASFSGQSAGKNLDSSEKFILGGPYGVRAYPVSEALGDNGWLASLEAHYDFSATALGQWQAIAFFDTGHITLHHDQDGLPIATATGQNGYSLSGWGLGVNLTQNGSYTVRAGWSAKIGSNPGRSVVGADADGSTDKSRFWLQAMLWM